MTENSHNKSHISIKRIVVLTVVILGLLSILWFAGGRIWVDQFVARFTESREEFIIPAAQTPLNSAVTQDQYQFTVCNRGVAPWGRTLIRINGGYLAKLKRLAVGDCARIKKTSFLSTDWKHVPAAGDLQVTEAEILADVTGVGYAREHVAH